METSTHGPIPNHLLLCERFEAGLRLLRQVGIQHIAPLRTFPHIGGVGRWRGGSDDQQRQPTNGWRMSPKARSEGQGLGTSNPPWKLLHSRQSDRFIIALEAKRGGYPITQVRAQRIVARPTYAALSILFYAANVFITLAEIHYEQ